MQQIEQKAVLDILEKVRYPGTGKNILEQGMIENLQINSEKIAFDLIFEKSTDPFMRSVVKSAKSTITAFLGEKIDVDINVKSKQTPRPKTDELLPEVKNKIAVYSGKGGVGKSTVAANLAISLAKSGYSVGLLDADIFGPSIPKMFGTEKEQPYMETIEGRQQIVPLEKFGIKLLSIGYFVNPDNALIWRGTMASNALKQLITDTYWGKLDFFIIDMPPGTSDIHLTIVQTLALTGTVIVTTPQEVALADARKGISMFKSEKINVPVLGLIENMSWFTPSELPNNRYYIFGKNGGERLANAFDIPLLGQIPVVQSICDNCDAGIPSALGDGVISEYFEQLSNNLVKQVEYRNLHLKATQRVFI